MNVNPSMSSTANLMRIINNSNPGKNFTSSQFTLGIPVANPEEDAKNTTIKLTARHGGGYTGEVDVTYNRTALTDNVADPVLEFTSGNTWTSTMAENAVTEAWGLLGGEISVSSTSAPSAPATSREVTVTAYSYSKVYQGSVTITLHYFADHGPLADAVENRELGGFLAVR